jgi:cytochrome b
MEHHRSESQAAARPAASQVLVWDLPLRIFHWLLALTMLGAWVSHELGVRYMEWHMRLGYLALGLVIFRIGWGIVGTRHARFATFLAGPKTVVAHAREWLGGRAEASAGHNPLGGWAIIAMLASVAIQALSGLFNTDDILTTGPWRPAVSEAFADRMSAIHSINFDFLAGLIALHLTAISAYWLRSRINLVGPMLTGRKSAAPGDGIDGQSLGIALAVAIAAALMVTALIMAAPEPDPAGLFF